MKKLLLLCVPLCVLLSTCARAPLGDPAQSFRPAGQLPELNDSFPLETLTQALERNIVAIQKGVNIPTQYNFAGRLIPRADYLAALVALRPELVSWERFHAFVRENFDFYEVYGNEEGSGVVFSTGYYDPVIQGSPKRTAAFSRPLYRTPPDLVTVDLGAFAARFPEQTELGKIVAENRALRPSWKGRYLASSRSVVPYYSRSEIDAGNVLAGKGLEIAWVDPVESFFLEIQGSGLVVLTNGKKMRVGYAEKNGHKYAAIGKFLTHLVPLEEMSMQRIRQELAKMTAAERDQIFALNPSYVFFQELPGLSLTFSGAETTPQRTIATDQYFFPKGTLNFFEIELPVFADPNATDPVSWEQKPRWVFDQDTGGAIRGGGRVDLYMGQGAPAAQLGGVMKRNGKLWALAPKESFLARVRVPSSN